MEMAFTVHKGKMMKGKRKFQKAINPMDKFNPGVIVLTRRTARACAHSDVWRISAKRTPSPLGGQYCMHLQFEDVISVPSCMTHRSLGVSECGLTFESTEDRGGTER